MSLLNGFMLNAVRLRFGLRANNQAEALAHLKPLGISVMCWDDVSLFEAARDSELGLDGAVCGQASQRGK